MTLGQARCQVVVTLGQTGRSGSEVEAAATACALIAVARQRHHRRAFAPRHDKRLPKTTSKTAGLDPSLNRSLLSRHPVVQSSLAQDVKWQGGIGGGGEFGGHD